MGKVTRTQIDAFALVIFFLITILYAYIFRESFLGYSLFVGAMMTLPPTLYLSVRKPKNWAKILIGTLIFGLIFGFALSFFAEVTDSWTVSNNVFGFRFFGENTLEEVLGHGMMALLTFTFYEHFLDTETITKANRKYLLAILLGFAGTLLLMSLNLYVPTLLKSLNYPYFQIGVVAIIPLALTIIIHPNLLRKLALLGVYFFALYFTIEIFAVAYGYWSYTGNNYIGWVEILNLRYPLEELLFWMLLYAPTITVYYEYFIDDNK